MNEKKTTDEKGGYVIEGTAQQSSMELNRTAKGDFSWSVKVYNDDPAKAEATLRDMKARIEAIIAEAK